MSSGAHILVVGGGSVGKRHGRNLASLGARVSVVDPRADRREEFAAETPVVGSHESLEAALAAGGLDGAVIGSPTAFHEAQGLACLRARLPLLMEKPLSMDAAEAERLAVAAREAGVPALLGYTWRWWPPLRRLKERLGAGEIGRVVHVQFHMSAHLADWHPWEDYRDFFMSKKALGGGALLDESHWIDLLLWFFGRPDRLYAEIGTISGLEIDSDDNVDMLLGYDSGLRASLHLDLYGRPHEKFIRFVGEEGTLLWSADPNRILLGREGAQQWEEESFDCERNEMFLAVAREYLALLAGDGAPSCSFADGLAVMEVIDAARRSSDEGRRLDLKARG